MNTTASYHPPATTPADTQRFLPMLLILFLGSGCAALIYEIVWFQMLQLVIGSSAVSLGVLLGTYMGGMCLGSFLLSRIISGRYHPLRVYAVLELGIGVIGIAVLYGVPSIGQLYSEHVGLGLPGILLRGVVSAACLLPPTLLMGATLPAMARWTESSARGVAWLGFFYGANIAGAVCGCLLAGFYLLRVHDMAVATYTAAAINATVAILGFILSLQASHAIPEVFTATLTPDTGVGPARRGPGSVAVYVAIALSGMSALGAEVIWTRLLSLMMGGTVYTFSIILAVFLVGLGIGSSAGSYIARDAARPRLALGACQLLLMLAIGWTAYMLCASLPFWPINPMLTSNPWFIFQMDLARCCWALLPAALLWGASFPLALAAAAAPGQDPGRLVGGVYAANTVGAIVGALAFSMLIIPWHGTQRAQQLLVIIAALAVIVLIFPAVFGRARTALPGTQPLGAGQRLENLAWLIIALAFGIGIARGVPATPWTLIAYGHYLPSRDSFDKLLYMGEGINASVAVTEGSDGMKNFHVSGKVEASTGQLDMRLQRMLGHVPALLHPDPKSVLVVGCGAGVTAGSFTRYPGIQHITLCEIEPLIPTKIAPYFTEQNYDIVHNPRLKIVYDDARNFIFTTKEKFDIITSDPIHPWVKGAATLYTKEYFELVKQHLNPGGLVTQWVPLYESTPEVVQSEFKTFFEAFPNGTVWSNDDNGAGYDVVLLGQVEPLKIDLAAIETRLQSPAYAPVMESLQNVEFKNFIDVLATYSGQASDLKPWLENAEINNDRDLRLQYLAGMGLNLYQGGPIFDGMLQYYHFPKNLIVAPPERMDALQAVMDHWQPKK